jgi:CPA2 family monovalent cation:H+ antiporter-2
VKYARPIEVVTVAVIAGKVLTCSFGSFVAGNDVRTSLRVGMGMAQIGEFSFIIATLGLTLKVTSPFLYPIAVAVSVLTTLIAPYLIRASDGIAAGVLWLAPRSFVNYVELYSRWMSDRGDANRERDAARVGKLLRRWILQIALNGVLAAAVLAVASAVAGDVRRLPAIQRLPHWTGGPNTIVWLAAMILVLPLLIVSVRKLRATAIVVSEVMVKSSEAGASTATVRGVVVHTILVTGFVLIGMSVLLMSSAFLPPGPVLVSLLLWGAGLGLLMWRRFERMYTKAQAHLTDMLLRDPEVRHAEAAKKRGGAAADAEHFTESHSPLPAVLRKAELETVVVARGAPAAGKLIRELHLRRLTGATVVGIERGGSSIVNPGPDEELQPNDGVLLIGTRPQLEAARPLLRGKAA